MKETKSKKREQERMETAIKKVIDIFGDEYAYSAVAIHKKSGIVSVLDSCNKGDYKDMNYIGGAYSEVLNLCIENDENENPAIRLFNVFMDIIFEQAKKSEGVRLGLISELEKLGKKAVEININQKAN